MHDGDHDILDGQGSHGHHEHNHDHEHDHEHKEEDTVKKKSDRTVKIVAGLVSIGLIIVFVLWKLI